VRLRKKQAPPKPIYAFSEHVTAGPHSLWHISPVVSGELKLGGGAPAPLCGRAWFNGWHLDAGLNEETGLLLTAWVNDQKIVCGGCAARWYEKS
jgi:hypothetical protein